MYITIIFKSIILYFYSIKIIINTYITTSRNRRTTCSRLNNHSKIRQAIFQIRTIIKLYIRRRTCRSSSNMRAISRINTHLDRHLCISIIKRLMDSANRRTVRSTYGASTFTRETSIHVIRRCTSFRHTCKKKSGNEYCHQQSPLDKFLGFHRH